MKRIILLEKHFDLMDRIRAVFTSLNRNILFEPNDQDARDFIKRNLERIIPHDLDIICDETNNTAYEINNNFVRATISCVYKNRHLTFDIEHGRDFGNTTIQFHYS